MEAIALPEDIRTLARPFRGWTVEEYHAMGAAGVFAKDNRVELLDGYLLAMSPIGSRHLFVVTAITDMFYERLLAQSPRLARVIVQNPVRLGPRSEPQPDVALLRPDVSPDRTPTPSDVLLVVEVADTTLAYDRRVKRPRYAAAGIPEVWVVALDAGYVEVARRPQPDDYAEIRRLGPADVLTVEALPNLPPILVADLLGGA